MAKPRANQAFTTGPEHVFLFNFSFLNIAAVPGTVDNPQDVFFI